MAEVVGLVAAIVGLTGAGHKISMALRALACEVQNAGRDIQDVASSVSLFSMTLKQVGVCLHDKHVSQSDDAVDTVEEIVLQCETIFDQLRSMISEAKRTSDPDKVNIRRRFGWVFKKSKLRYLTSRLESSKLTLSIMLQVLHMGRTMEASSQAHDDSEETRVAIDTARAEVQSLVLDRMWSISKESQLSEEGNNNAGRLSSVQATNADDTSDSDQVASPLAMSGDQQLIPRSSKSLAALDASLGSSDAQTMQLTPQTLAQSSNAIDYLLGEWYKPSQSPRSPPSEPACESLHGSGVNNVQPIPPRNTKKDASALRGVIPIVDGSNTAGTLQIRIPQPPTEDIPLDETTAQFLGIVWRKPTVGEYISVVSRSDGFCWQFITNSHVMYFMQNRWIGTEKTVFGERTIAKQTVLPETWFDPSEVAILYPKSSPALLKYGSLDIKGSPLDSSKYNAKGVQIPGLLTFGLVQNCRNARKSIFRSGRGHLSQTQHIDHLFHLQMLRDPSSSDFHYNPTYQSADDPFPSKYFTTTTYTVDTSDTKGGSGLRPGDYYEPKPTHPLRTPKWHRDHTPSIFYSTSTIPPPYIKRSATGPMKTSNVEPLRPVSRRPDLPPTRRVQKATATGKVEAWIRDQSVAFSSGSGDAKIDDGYHAPSNSSTRDATIVESCSDGSVCTSDEEYNKNKRTSPSALSQISMLERRVMELRMHKHMRDSKLTRKLYRGKFGVMERPKSKTKRENGKAI